MRLGIFLQHYFPYGGLQRDALRLAHAAKEAGDEPIIAVSQWDGPLPDDIKVLVLNSGGRSNHQKAKLFARNCQSLYEKEKLDTAICFSRVPGTPFHFCGDPCFKERFQRTKPTLLAILPRYKYLLHAESDLFGALSKTHIFYLAASEIPAYKQYYPLPTNQYTLLPPWLKKPTPNDLPKTQLKTKLLSELDLPHSSQLLLFVGSDFKRKGLDRAIRALAKMENKDTILVACGQDNPSAYLKLAQDQGVAHRVRIPGPRDDIPAWMAAADLLIHPAHQETAGMVLLESLTYSLPVVCTENCGYAPYVKESGCPLIPKDCTPEQISVTIDLMIHQKSELQSQIKEWLSLKNRYETANIILELMRHQTCDHNQNISKK